MGTTSPDLLPWPEYGDPADGPAAFQALATATQTALTGLRRARPHRLLIRSAPASIPNGSVTLFTGGWTSAPGDSPNAPPLTYSTGKITVTEDLMVGFQLYGSWSTASAGERRMEVNINGVGAFRDNRIGGSPSGVTSHSVGLAVVFAPAGTWLQASCYQTSGAALDLNSARFHVWEVGKP